MPKIIFTSRFIRNPSKANAGKLLNYMGTREGVEKLEIGVDHSPSTAKQQTLIEDIVTHLPETKDYPEYEDYNREPSKSNATEFIDAVIERNTDRINGIKNLVKYYGERPSVEKLGAHGLFSQTDDKIDIEKVAEEVSNHKGIIWTHVVSLRREDAERLGYNNAIRWRDLIRSNITEIADAHNIDLTNLKWYASFHNTTHHPHIHLMVYANDASQGWTTKRSIDDMRSLFGNEIFRCEQYKLFEIQTEQRNKIKRRFKDLLVNFETEKFVVTPHLNELFLTLARQLKNVKGKKVYGYLPKKVKCTVNKIVAEIAKDKTIAELYSKWNEINREKLSLYHEKKTPDIPLEENKEFRSIKNMIVKSVAEYIENDSVQTNESFNDTGFIFSGIILSLLKLFALNYNRHEENLSGQADRKLRSKIAEKKMAQGIRPQYSGNQNGWKQNM